MSLVKKSILLVVLGLFSGLSMDVSADENDLQISGYLTQAWVKTDKNNYFGPSTSSGGSWEFNEFGLALSKPVNEHLMFSAGVVTRKAGGTDNGSVRFDYAHAVYDTNVAGWGSRTMVGLNKLDWGYYNSTRDVATTRPSILLPQSQYTDNARKFEINAYGIEQAFSKDVGENNFLLKFYLEKPAGADNPETKRWFLGYDDKGKLDMDWASGFSAQWTDDTNLLRVYVGRGTVRYTPTANDYLHNGTVDTYAMWLTYIKNMGSYTFASEVYASNADYKNFGAYLPDFFNRARGAYIELRKQVNNDFSMFARRDIIVLNLNDKSGSQLHALTGRPASDGFGYDTTIGGRYRTRENQYLSAELHHVNGTYWLPMSDQPTNRQQNWNIFLLQYTINF